MSTRRETIARISSALTPLYDLREAQNIARTIISELGGVSFTELVSDPDAALCIEGLESVIAQLATGRPVQYVVGYTEFCGLQIAVREGVLIPRPETEELVMWIAAKERKAQYILDVGTGSGCIALATKNLLTKAKVFGADISEDALTISASNASHLKLEVTFRKADALSNLSEIFPERFDVIVSNPPYVPQSDRVAMHTNVRDYEPDSALFVPDDDPLRFYRAIAHTGRRMLSSGGRLYFEIYHLHAEAMRQMLAEEGYTATEVREDLAGKPRMICSRLK